MEEDKAMQEDELRFEGWKIGRIAGLKRALQLIPMPKGEIKPERILLDWMISIESEIKELEK